MSRSIIATAAIILSFTAGLARAESPVATDAAIAGQGNAALSTMQADLVAALPVVVSLPPLNAQPVETVELGYLIAVQGDAALERVARQLPQAIQADLALPELSVTTHMASVATLQLYPTDI